MCLLAFVQTTLCIFISLALLKGDMVKIDFEIHGAILALICIAVVALVIVCIDVIVPEQPWTAPAEAPAEPPKYGRTHPENQWINEVDEPMKSWWYKPADWDRERDYADWPPNVPNEKESSYSENK